MGDSLVGRRLTKEPRLKEHMLLARDHLLTKPSNDTDKHKRQHDFKIGDKGWVARTNREKTKFGSIMKGSYEILELIGDTAINVRHPAIYY